MRENLLENLYTLVVGVMCVGAGVIAALCFFLILRWEAFRPLLPSWRRPKKSKAEEDIDRKQRRRIRLWFWD